VRIAAEARLWIRDANSNEQLNRTYLRRLLRHLTVRLDCLNQLLLNAQHRVERGHWVLEDHGNLTAAHLAKLLFFEGGELTPFELDTSTFDAAGRLWQ
jgi:hypothetical protein